MADIAQRIRDAIDSVEPIPLAEIQALGARRARRQRPLRILAGVATVAALVAAVVVAAVLAGPPSGSVSVDNGPSPSTSTSASSSVTRHGVTVTLTLDRTTVVTGTTIPGRLTVDNRTGRPYREGPLACPGDMFSVYLEGGRIPYSLGSPGACTPPYTYRIGVTSFPFSIATTQSAVGGSTVAVPPGRYRAVVEYLTVQGDRTLPTPPALPVVLTPAGAAPASSTPAVRIAVHLAAATVRAGTTVKGSAAVTNLTGRAIVVRACPGGWPAIALTGHGLHNAVNPLRLCLGFRLPPGTSNFDVRVITTYAGCASVAAGVTPDNPRCRSYGLPALPAGPYRTTISAVGLPPGTWTVTEATLDLTH